MGLSLALQVLRGFVSIAEQPREPAHFAMPGHKSIDEMGLDEFSRLWHYTGTRKAPYL